MKGALLRSAPQPHFGFYCYLVRHSFSLPPIVALSPLPFVSLQLPPFSPLLRRPCVSLLQPLPLSPPVFLRPSSSRTPAMGWADVRAWPDGLVQGPAVIFIAPVICVAVSWLLMASVRGDCRANWLLCTLLWELVLSVVTAGCCACR